MSLSQENAEEPKTFPTIVWYRIPVIKDGMIYSQRIELKRFDNAEDADNFIFSEASRAGSVGWSSEEDFNRLYKDKLLEV